MAGAGAELETIWRTHRLSLVSALAARFRDLDLAEDVLADALLKAEQEWTGGPPDNPKGWLYRVALRKALDRLRRKSTEISKADALAQELENPVDAQEETMPEARLGLFFHCAHPALSPEAQTALMLFHVAGLKTGRIAKSFLTSETTIQQRLKRARDKLKANQVAFEPPEKAAWPNRLPPILSAIEIIYDQSYSDLDGGIEVDALGQDAIQLARTLAILLPQEAEVLSLAAMLELCEARRPARTDQDGKLIPLKSQDHRRWNTSRLSRAGRYMQAAAATVGTSVLAPGPYAIRARIHASHGAAIASGIPRHGELVDLYDDLMVCAPSPVVAINRALAVADRDGAPAGLDALEDIEAKKDLSSFAPWHLARAELHGRLGDKRTAEFHLNAARQLTAGATEKAFITEKIALLSD